MLDDHVADDVKAELAWDPRVDGRAVAVSAHDGVVTLRGTVGSLREKQEARRAAARVRGVHSVDNRLQVRILHGERRDDADLRGDVLRALMLDSRIPPTIDATVKSGTVTITGPVTWVYQRVEAEEVLSRIPGVVEVENRTYLECVEPVATDVAASVRRALARNAGLDARTVGVAADNGWVTLTGRVHSWAAHDTAMAAAWAAPGVGMVEDRLTVLP
jgi:osmotically-inducible protein OsmY